MIRLPLSRRNSFIPLLLGAVAATAIVHCGDSEEVVNLSDGGGPDVGKTDGATTDAKTDGGVVDGSNPDSGTVGPFQICATVNGLAGNVGDAGVEDAGAGALVLKNGVDSINVSKNGQVCFPTKVPANGQFEVTKIDPTNPVHSCTVTGGTGVVVASDVTTVTVNCDVTKYTVGGNVAGLAGSGGVLTLRDENGNTVQTANLSALGTYAFPNNVPSGAHYDVIVSTQPSGIVQNCTVANGIGQVKNANVQNVNINCTTTTFPISGQVTGLAGTGLILTNGGENLPVSGTGTVPFAFTQQVASGASFNVQANSPTGPSQTCLVQNGSGTIGNAAVTNVVVACTTNSYVVKGTLKSPTLAITLQNNGGNDVTVGPGSVPFAFPAQLSGTGYNVTAPAGCTVTNGSGTVTTADVSNVLVSCSETTTLAFTGAMQTFTVPAGVTSVFIEAFGAQGSAGSNGNSSAGATLGGAGGLGGLASGFLATSGGAVLNVFVGGQGTTGVGGFNGGANGGTQNSGGGGGASDVRVGGTAEANRVITAGGGGGGGRGGCESGTGIVGGAGGAGGGGNGGNGVDAPTSGGVAGGGAGAIGSAAGARGVGCAGFLGSNGTAATGGVGGAGGAGQSCCCFSFGSIPGGGGGGGGFVGGGGGGGGSAGTTGCSGNDKGGGGGGAGGTSNTAGVTSGVKTNGVRSGNGQVKITYSLP